MQNSLDLLLILLVLEKKITHKGLIMPLEKIHTLLQNHTTEIEAWFAKQWQGLVPLPYFSCDIRHASYKIGVVDTNLFPAGFNNLCTTFTKDTATAFAKYFDAFYPSVKKILLYGENHTRNKFYLLNLVKLQELIQATGRDCHISLPLDDFPQEKITVPLDAEHQIVINRVQQHNHKIAIGDWQPDIILSNNDFSSGLPAQLENIDLPITPSPLLGWHNRFKSDHFRILSTLLTNFGTTFDMNPWELTPISETAQNIHEDNLSELANKVEQVLEQIKEKYAVNGITQSPYVFVKNDSGTYGLGIITAGSKEEILNLNRKKRMKLFATKGKTPSSQFLVQEGIPTTDTYSGFPIEPVIYAVGQKPVGGFFRIHEAKNTLESLNAPGMSFSCLCLHKLDEPHETYFINCQDKKALVGGAMFLTRFAGLAAAIENKALHTHTHSTTIVRIPV